MVKTQGNKELIERKVKCRRPTRLTEEPVPHRIRLMTRDKEMAERPYLEPVDESHEMVTVK